MKSSKLLVSAWTLPSALLLLNRALVCHPYVGCYCTRVLLYYLGAYNA